MSRLQQMESDSFFLGKDTKVIKQTKEYTIHELLPNMGIGTIEFYNLIPGVFVYVNDFVLKNKRLINDNTAYAHYSMELLKLDFCIQGKLLTTDKTGKSCITKAGQTSYYSNNKNVYQLETLEKCCKTVGIIGYTHDIVKVLSDFLLIDQEIVQTFFDIINNQETYISIRSNLLVERLVKDILEAIGAKNFEQMKLKSLEWLIYEIKHIHSNLKNRESVYKKETIDKIFEAENYIIKSLSKKMTVDSISKQVGIGVSTLKQGFRLVYGNSVYNYVKVLRLKHGMTLLRDTNMSITEIALECGYDNLNSFTKAFKKEFRLTPRELRKQ